MSIQHKLDTINRAPKDVLLKWLEDKKWKVARPNLSRARVEELRTLMREAMEKYGTVREVQAFEKDVITYYMQRHVRSEMRLNKNKEKKDAVLDWAREHFKIGAIVKIFDEVLVGHHGQTPVYHEVPLDARIVELSDDMKNIKVEFIKTRKWHEAGGWPVHKGQQLRFLFDHVTCKWLREGLTAEVCRSYDKTGKVRYFDLSFTRQYIISP